jgi:glutathione S-transferase
LTYTLYHSPGACSTGAHIVLEEIGAPYELVLISSRGEREGPGTTSEEWRAINPKGRVPALATVAGSAGGAPGLLTETAAILFYLALTHPEAGLLPNDAAGRARCLEWTNFLATSVHAMACGQVWRAHRFSEDEAALASIRAKGRANLIEHYAYIEHLLGDGRDHAVPGGYSIVDPYLLVFFGWGQRIGIDMRGEHPAWSRATDRVLERPAVRRVLEKEGLSLA